MLHPNTVLRFISDEMGYGVFATRRLEMGTIVYARDGLEIEIPPGHQLLQDERYAGIIEKYSYIEPSGDRVLSWDISRFVNHSCAPNILSTGYGFEIAIRDIEVGEEVCDDYGLLNIERPMPCLCGASECRSQILPDDLLRHARQWNTQLKPALTKVLKVEQPLWDYLEKSTQSALKAGKRHSSVAGLYYKHHADQIAVKAAGERSHKAA